MKGIPVTFAQASELSAAPEEKLRERSGITDRDVVAEVVWFDAVAGKNHIYHAHYRADEWHKTEAPLVTSDRSITTPVLATLPDGHKVLFWSEARATEGMDLKYMFAHRGAHQNQRASQLQWSSPKILSALGSYNLGAMAVVDDVGQVWVFWSADNEESSDVFMTRRTSTGWTLAQRIHPANTTPDINIRLELSDKGEIVASWNSLDTETLSYVEKSKKFIAQDSPNAQSQLESRVSTRHSLDDISIPGFVPENQRLIIHFPGNRQHPLIPVR
jgi:hypothetical protein